jgi:hypothetical protein
MAASCRRGRFERLVRALSMYVVGAIGTSAGTAQAADLPANYCALERAPALDWLRLAKGDDCPLDEDGNGLDDRMEIALARCFVPEIIFDSREMSVRADEPHVVFSADPIAPRVIRLHFAILFAKDGGYVLGTEFPCLRDEHNGDSEAVTVDVMWLERDHRWFGAPLSMHTGGPNGVEERTLLSSDSSRASLGTHPRLYATAGKHHWLHQPASLSYACSCGPLGPCGSVRDRADGAGVRTVPTSLRHAPRFMLREGTSARPNDDVSGFIRVRPAAPLDSTEREFRNACVHRSRGIMTAARSLGSNDLADLGYPGERVFGSCFRGGLGGPCHATVSVGEVLAWDSPPGAMGRGSDVAAGKLISTLLGIVGRPPTAQSGKVKVPGRFGPRLYAVPSGPASSSLE